MTLICGIENWLALAGRVKRGGHGTGGDAIALPPSTMEKASGLDCGKMRKRQVESRDDLRTKQAPNS